MASDSIALNPIPLYMESSTAAQCGPFHMEESSTHGTPPPFLCKQPCGTLPVHAGIPTSLSSPFTPFQPICTPMLRTMNADRRNTTIMPLCPIRDANGLA